MILSMTGFATSTVEIPLSNNGNMLLSISIKSLNSRYFEMTCKIPSIFSNLEVQIQRILQKQLHRGHVSLHIKILNTESLYNSVKPSLQTIASYFDAIGIIQHEFNIQEQITLAQILQLPNALQAEELQLNESTEQLILHAIMQTAESMIETQKEEGLQLARDIKEQLASMAINIAQIQKLSIINIQEKKELLTHIMTQLAAFEPLTGTEQKSTEQCLLEAKKTTLMYEIEKIDINEETVRFNSHLNNVTLQFDLQDPLKGKKLDFTIQELNREINTIASKCSNIAISSLAIDIKSQLEKAREQAQNII
jgi:uncharacterized protein (TIGR00255 family)